MSTLPDFISHSSEFDPQLPPPYEFKGVSSRIFALKADKAKLQSLCDKHINDVATASGETFVIKPIQSIVLMEALTYERMYSTFAGAGSTGYSSQNELLFAIPVALYATESLVAKDIVHRVGLFVPFLFVDHDWSQVAGREIVGFPKLAGQFQLPEDSADSGPLEVKANVLDPYAADTQSVFRPIVQIDASDSTQPRLPTDKKAWPFGPIDELYDPKRDGVPFPVTGGIESRLKDSAGAFVSNFSLRQFREGTNPVKASFRSILRARMELESFGSAHLLPDTVCRFPGSSTNPYKGYRSLDLVNELGLELLNEQGDVKAELAIFLEGDYHFDIEETLLTQCGSNIWTQPPDLGCVDLISKGLAETRQLAKRQTRVAKRVMKRIVNAELDPVEYLNDLEKGCKNAMKFSKAICKLTKTSLQHLAPD